MAKKKLNTTSLISEAAGAISEPPSAEAVPAPAAVRTGGARGPEKRKRDQGTEQLNIRVASGTGKDIKMWAMAHDVNPADVIEQGFELMKAKWGA